MRFNNYRYKKNNKYNSCSIEYNGIKFDSQRELSRWLALVKLYNEGIISNLERQVKYVLIPAQYGPSTIGKRGGVKKGKLLERECSYVADFVYTVNESGLTVVEDTKGFRTKDYIIKRKLMLFVYGIKIKEI